MKMPYEFNFDYMRFQKLMVESYSPFFLELREAHTTETIFAYALASFGEFEIMVPICITEKNSDWETCAQPQWQNVRLPSIDMFDALMRFDKLESRRSRASRRFSNMIITAREEGISEEEIEKMQQPLLDEYRQVCINALKKMDTNGVFGVGDDRENIAVLLLFIGYVDNKERILIHPD